jgi:hypothetical protein
LYIALLLIHFEAAGANVISHVLMGLSFFVDPPLDDLDSCERSAHQIGRGPNKERRAFEALVFWSQGIIVKVRKLGVSISQ